MLSANSPGFLQRGSGEGQVDGEYDECRSRDRECHERGTDHRFLRRPRRRRDCAVSINRADPARPRSDAAMPRRQPRAWILHRSILRFAGCAGSGPSLGATCARLTPARTVHCRPRAERSRGETAMINWIITTPVAMALAAAQASSTVVGLAGGVSRPLAWRLGKRNLAPATDIRCGRMTSGWVGMSRRHATSRWIRARRTPRRIR